MRTLKNCEIDVRYLKHLGERGRFAAHWNIRANEICQMRYYYHGLVSCPLIRVSLKTLFAGCSKDLRDEAHELQG